MIKIVSVIFSRRSTKTLFALHVDFCCDKIRVDLLHVNIRVNLRRIDLQIQNFKIKNKSNLK
jgi:hypothetical protein